MKLNKKFLACFIIVIHIILSYSYIKYDNTKTTKNIQHTLSGIDLDSDGIRDDVQEWISERFSKNSQLESAYKRYAIAQQNFMKSVENNSLTPKNLQDKYDTLDCLSFLQQDRTANDIVLELDLIILNTIERLEASQKEWSLVDGVDNSVKISEFESKCSIVVIPQF